MIRNSAIIYLTIVVGSCFGSTFGQQSVSQNTASAGRIQSPPVATASLGSVKGLVFNDAERLPTGPKGIGGVRVILRSKDLGTATGIGNKITDADGRYIFSDVVPGEYSIEVDPLSVPAKYRIPRSTVLPVSIAGSGMSIVDLPISARRVITGIVYVDMNRDGIYTPQKDEPVAGADITVQGRLTTTDMKGRYILNDLPAGRIGLLATPPHNSANVHVVLDLGTSPVINRVVNIPVGR